VLAELAKGALRKKIFCAQGSSATPL
jgi:transposase